MRTLLLTLVAALLTLAASAELVVYPFESQDPIVGIAIADRIAAALGEDVIGPAAAPALVVPIVAPAGFVNPTVFLGDGGGFGRNGAWLLRGVVGSRAAVTGSVRAEGDSLVLDLIADVGGRDLRARLEAPREDPGALAWHAAAVLAGWLGIDRQAQPPLDLRGADAAHARAIGLVGAGLPREALAALDDAAGIHALSSRAEDLRRTIREAVEAEATHSAPEPASRLEGAAVGAVTALNLGGDPELALRAFEVLADFDVAVAQPWIGALAHNDGDSERAERAFDAAGSRSMYDFGAAARAAYRVAVGDAVGSERDLRMLSEWAAKGVIDPAGALAGSIVANLAERPDLEAVLLVALGRTAPYLVYSFERRSFIAFDADDALAAARALAVAVELESDSDLYWTNYGWALYLLGFLERSEGASRRALELDASQYIGRYNLALVEVVTDRLDDALASYREARRYDDGVDPEVIVDLVDAEARYPDAIGVPVALGVMLEAAGDRAAAADAFARYALAAQASPDAPAADPVRAREALERADALRSPLPPIAIEGEPALRLGRRGPVLDVPRPGDPLVVSFEVVTAGDSLPRTLRVRAVVDDDGEVVAEVAREVDIPSGAIGYVVDVARLGLPVDLAPGRYTLTATATGDEQEAEAIRTFEVRGAPDVARLLIGRDVAMLTLETGQPLYGVRDLERGDAVLEALVQELRGTAAVADEVLPVPEGGRFAGLSGGDVFMTSTVDDVRDFVLYLVDGGAQDTSFTFVDGYADWAVDGAPVP